jgi:bacterial/archaeal transporter family-2 protein
MSSSRQHEQGVIMVYFLLAVMAGLAGVLQSGLNKKIGLKTGLAYTLHIGNFVVLVGGVFILYVIARLSTGDFGKMVRFKFPSSGDVFQWWYLVPGFMGLFFIISAPYAISKIGALKVFIGIMAAQVIGSFIWDLWVEKIPSDTWRIVGALLTLAGAGALSLSKS